MCKETHEREREREEKREIKKERKKVRSQFRLSKTRQKSGLDLLKKKIRRCVAFPNKINDIIYLSKIECNSQVFYYVILFAKRICIRQKQICLKINNKIV